MNVETLPANPPSCPNSFAPLHPLHAALNRTADILSRNLPRDEDREFTEEVGGAYHQVVYGPQQEMRLYRESTMVVARPLAKIVAYYWRCGTCGFVLPAQEVPYS